jgi:hypothetical protein
MSLTNFPGGLTSFGNVLYGGLGIGNVYYVVNTTSTTAYKEMLKRYGGERYEDGSAVLHPHTSTASTVTLNGLKSALAATVEDRNDYVVVMGANSTYYIDEALALNKKNVHIICPSGMGYDRGSTNSVRIQQITALTAIFAVADASVEIAGFYLKAIDGASAITLAATSYAPNIHHNYFPLIWSTLGVGSIIGTGDGGAWGKIERNTFISQSGGGVTCAAGVIQIQASATGCGVNYNEIILGDTQIATVGIANGAVKGQTNFNIFSESGGAAVASGGTITKCISIAATGCAIGNRAAVGTTQVLTGGTSAHSYSDNIGGVTGDAGQATQLES